MCLFVCACVKEENHELLGVSTCTWCNTATKTEQTCGFFSQRQKRLTFQPPGHFNRNYWSFKEQYYVLVILLFARTQKNGEVQVDPT